MLSNELFVNAATSGFVLGLGMIFSIGPQNLQLLSAGASNDNPTIVATTGYISEILIMAVGVLGFGISIQAYPEVGAAMRGLGIAFLLWCGVCAIRGRSRENAAVDIRSTMRPRHKAILAMLSVTWLNPLVYVEVMLLAGVASSTFGGAAQLWFSAGFLAASAIKFYGWSFAGSLLRVWISEPRHRRQFALASGTLLLCAAALLARQVLADL